VKRGNIFKLVALAAGVLVLTAAAQALGEDVKITVVYDNNPYDRRLETAWGFACLVEGFEKVILFDTGGDGDTLLANMAALGYTPGDVDVVVLSHAHGDHVGGLPQVLEENPAVTVYAPSSFAAGLKNEAKRAGATLVEVEGSCDICPGVGSTGEMGTSIVEQALVAKTPLGLVVITGCAHPGIVSVVGRARSLYGEKVCVVLGGFHLGAADDAELKDVVAAFREMDVRYAGPCHCSGDRARQIFADEFRERYLPVGVGTVVEVSALG
jgi:7,8-dihydropterin-6-yl-methyl-4-(beta-D-ribofuranosyl)aminobenzene 5'-phosphate synthase